MGEVTYRSDRYSCWFRWRTGCGFAKGVVYVNAHLAVSMLQEIFH